MEKKKKNKKWVYESWEEREYKNLQKEYNYKMEKRNMFKKNQIMKFKKFETDEEFVNFISGDLGNKQVNLNFAINCPNIYYYYRRSYYD